MDKEPLDFVGGLFCEGQRNRQQDVWTHNVQTLMVKIQNPDINSWKPKSTRPPIGFLQQPLYVFIETLNMKHSVIWGRKWASTPWWCCPKWHVYQSSASHRLCDVKSGFYKHYWVARCRWSPENSNPKHLQKLLAAVLETLRCVYQSRGCVSWGWSKALRVLFPVCYWQLTLNLILKLCTSECAILTWLNLSENLQPDLVNNQKWQ